MRKRKKCSLNQENHRIVLLGGGGGGVGVAEAPGKKDGISMRSVNLQTCYLPEAKSLQRTENVTAVLLLKCCLQSNKLTLLAARVFCF